MKFRTLGVALVAGGGLALAALPASPAAAFGDQPYPPVDCAGPTGEGTVSKSVLLVGESTVFSGCGFEPGSPVQIEVNGVLETTTTANASGIFSVPINFPTAGTQALAGIGVAPPTAVGAVTPATPATSPAGILPDPIFPDPIFPEDQPAETPPSTAAVPAAPVATPAPLPTAPVQGAPDLLQTGLASEIAPPKAALQGGPRIVNASVLVIGLGAGGIVGLPVDPGLIGSWISDWGGDGFGKDHDRDRDCFGDGLDKDRENGEKDGDKVDGDKIDGENRDDKVDGDRRDGEDRDGLAAAEPTALLDDWDDKDDKDRDDKDDKDRDENGDCIVAGGIVGVGVGGGGAGAAGAGGGALPFTGVETGAMASIAVALLGGGVLLRVAARRRRLAGRVQG